MFRRTAGKDTFIYLLLFLVAACAQAQDPIMQFTFDDGTAADVSGNGNTGELLGTAAIVDDAERGQVLQVNGSGMQAAGLLDITTEFTLSAWTKLDVPRVGRFYFGGPWQIRTDNQGGTPHHWCEIRYPGGTFVDKFDTRTAANPDGQLDGEWHHIAVVLPEDGAVKAYVDGVPAPARDGAAKAYDYAGGVGPFFFGTQDAAGGNAIQGYMDDIRVYNEAIPEDQIPELMGPIVSRNTLDLDVTPPDAVLSWNARKGYLYTLQQTVDPALAPGGWTDVPSFKDVKGVDDAMSATTTLGSEPQEHFRLSIGTPEPFFFDDLEEGGSGWTNFANGGTTEWELGTPNYGDFTGAFSGSKAWATGIDTYYVQHDHPILRTPVIDLTGENAAVLSFMEVTDLEVVAGYGDYGYVDVLDAGGTVIGPEIYSANGSNSVWAQQKVSLDPYTNQQIIIQFRMKEDGYQFLQQYGWGIDDIMVSATAPPPPPPPAYTKSVTSFVLVDASSTNATVDLTTLTEGVAYDLDTLGVSFSNVNVRAETDGPVGSVRFALTGATTHNQTESVAPYYLFGDDSGIADPGTLATGTHNLVATPWSAGAGSGQPGTNLTVNFEIIYSSGP